MNIGDNIIDTRDIEKRIEELKEQVTPRWVAGWNMPGYMPDSKPAEFDNFEDARDYIVDEIDEEADSAEEAASEVGGAEVERLREAVEDIREAAATIRKLDDAFGVTLGRYHYFITLDGEMGLDDDEKEELEMLEEVFDELPKDESLIHDSYFVDWTMDFASELGIDTSTWPTIYIDWEKAADELKMDYTAYEIGDETYWGRA